MKIPSYFLILLHGSFLPITNYFGISPIDCFCPTLGLAINLSNLRQALEFDRLGCLYGVGCIIKPTPLMRKCKGNQPTFGRVLAGIWPTTDHTIVEYHDISTWKCGLSMSLAPVVTRASKKPMYVNGR